MLLIIAVAMAADVALPPAFVLVTQSLPPGLVVDTLLITVTAWLGIMPCSGQRQKAIPLRCNKKYLCVTF
ncbi:MAG: hypothetical protein ACRCRW_09330, partial [Aeromonadaceae bacterium]